MFRPSERVFRIFFLLPMFAHGPNYGSSHYVHSCCTLSLINIIFKPMVTKKKNPILFMDILYRSLPLYFSLRLSVHGHTTRGLKKSETRRGIQSPTSTSTWKSPSSASPWSRRGGSPPPKIWKKTCLAANVVVCLAPFSFLLIFPKRNRNRNRKQNQNPGEKRISLKPVVLGREDKLEREAGEKN